MPGSSQLSGPAYEENDVKITAENESVAFPCSKGALYIARDEIEERSPSRKDGIDSSKEYELRKSYCTFLKDLGIRLRMPHVVIATSTVFSHRFFLYQSHHKNDRYTIATACMFLAGKVEEARRALEEVVLVSYCLQNKKNPKAAQEFKEKQEVCERQKELVLLAEHMVLVTLDFELKVRHPHSFVLLAMTEFKFACEALAPVTHIILNDVLYTTLCLQFKPQHIAVSALLIAAKLLKFKFPRKNWWKHFQVTRHQLDEICNQILELYENERVPSSVVQSGSSSSSVGDRTNFLSERPSTVALGNLHNYGNAQEHPRDTSGDFEKNNSVSRAVSQKSSLAGRPPTMALATTRPKLGSKEIPKVSAKEAELTYREPEAPLRKKRPPEDRVDLQQVNRQKLVASQKKGSKGVSARSEFR